MRANFDEFRALFSSKYRRTFDRYFEAFARQFNEISTTIRQGKRKIESKNRKANRKIVSSNFRTSEISKKIRFKSNVISLHQKANIRVRVCTNTERQTPRIRWYSSIFDNA